MNKFNRIILLLSLFFIGLSTFEQSAHILNDHGLNEKIEHAACVLENIEPKTQEAIVINFISLSIESIQGSLFQPSKVYSFNSRAPPRKT